jgi:branched-chain amino acid transport system substrate-binding protein
MTSYRRRLAAVVAAGLLVSASACTKDSDGAAKTPANGKSGDVGKQLDDLTADCPQDFDTAGISNGTIKLFSTYPQDPPLDAFAEIARGYNAYFDKVNKAGGVEIAGKKYKIEVTGYNDKYNPSETVDQVTKAIGPDGTGAFAGFSMVGTDNNLAVREKLNDLCVPDIFASSGAPAMGNPKYPWVIGSSLPLYSTEAASFIEYLKANKPEAKIAMLLQNGEFGDGYQRSVEAAIKGTKIKVVAKEYYDAGLTTDVSSQVTNLAASGADVFFNGATLLPCPTGLSKAAELKWKPLTYVSGTCASRTLIGAASGDSANGAFSASNVMDPNNPKWDSDPRMKEFKDTLRAYAQGQGLSGDQLEAVLTNGVDAYGWTLGDLFVKALGKAKAATRTEIMKALNNIDEKAPGVLYQEITVKTGNDDRFLGEAVKLATYDSANKRFEPLDQVYDYEGGKAIPPSLITISG